MDVTKMNRGRFGPGRAVRLLLWGLIFLALLTGTSVKAQAASGPRFRARVGRTLYYAGEEQQISFKNTRYISYRFFSSNKKVMTVSKKGLIRARKRGSAQLTIRGIWEKKGKRRTWEKKVLIQVSRCRLSHRQLSLRQGQSAKLKLKIKGRKWRRKLRWSSSAPQVASVSSGGRVRAVTEGTALIYLRVSRSLTLTCRVTVTASVLPDKAISLLVNPTTTYGAFDVAADMRSSLNMGGPVRILVQNPALGSVRAGGTIYDARKGGYNTVRACLGEYRRDYRISQIVWSAHRGYSDIRPENTIDAYAAAALHGAAFIEADLRVTGDGELVMLHDKTLQRMTGDSRRVRDVSLAEIRALRLCSGNGLERCVYPPRIPTLEEYLSVCSRYRVIAIIDMKSLGRTQEQCRISAGKLNRALARYQMSGRCMLLSSSAKLLGIFREEAGAQIPAAASGSALEQAKGMGLANIYSGYRYTPFGDLTMLDYSPLIGRKGGG